MLTGKQRSYLKTILNNQEAIIQVGKGGMSQNLIKQIDEALEARELVKITVLETSPDDIRELCDEITKAVGAEFVQLIGKKFSIYRRAKESKIILP
jgi:RNA-binding protein